MDKVKPAVAQKPIPLAKPSLLHNSPFIPIKPSRHKTINNIDSLENSKNIDNDKPHCANDNNLSDIIHSPIMTIRNSSANTNNLFFSDVDDFNNSTYKINSINDNVIVGQNNRVTGDNDTNPLTLSDSPILTTNINPIERRGISTVRDSNVSLTTLDASVAPKALITICDASGAPNFKTTNINSESENPFTALCDASVLSQKICKKLPSKLDANFLDNSHRCSISNNIDQFDNNHTDSETKDITTHIDPVKLKMNDIPFGDNLSLNVKALPTPKPRVTLKKSLNLKYLADGNDSNPITCITAKPSEKIIKQDLFHHDISCEQNNPSTLLDGKLPLKTNSLADLNDIDNSKDNANLIFRNKSPERTTSNISKYVFRQDDTPDMQDDYANKNDKRKNSLTILTPIRDSSSIFKNFLRKQSLPESAKCNSKNSPRILHQVSTSSSVFYRDLSYTEVYNDIEESPLNEEADLNKNTNYDKCVSLLKESRSVRDIRSESNSRDFKNSFSCDESINDINANSFNGANNLKTKNPDGSIGSHHLHGSISNIEIDHLRFADKETINNGPTFGDIKKKKVPTATLR